MSFSGLRIPAYLAATLLLSACGDEVEVATEPLIRPVKTYTVESTDSAALRKFPGVVDASQRAELSFRVPGTLQKLLVKEGEKIKQGQLLARLDPTDYAIIVSDRKASAENAARNFERAKELIVSGHISRIDYDGMEADMKTSAAALGKANQDLAYTKLKAPFTGVVARRYIENFEEVAAKQKIFRVQNQGELEVKIALSEGLVRSLRRRSNKPTSQRVTAYAEFEGRAGHQFPLQVKEISNKADPETQTFQITLGMKAPEDFVVLPGMTTTVSVDFSKVLSGTVVHWIPARAVVAESELNALVWILDPATMTVNSRSVKIGRLSGSKIEIQDGLFGGEEVISVGASYLTEGMKVSRMIQSEQAEPRADDPA